MNHPYLEYGLKSIQAGHYFFEDETGNPIDLQSMWLRGTVQGKFVLMSLRYCTCYDKVTECSYLPRMETPWQSSDKVATMLFKDFGRESQHLLGDVGIEGNEEVGQRVSFYKRKHVYRVKKLPQDIFRSRDSPDHRYFFSKEKTFLRTKWILHNQELKPVEGAMKISYDVWLIMAMMDSPIGFDRAGPVVEYGYYRPSSQLLT